MQLEQFNERLSRVNLLEYGLFALLPRDGFTVDYPLYFKYQMLVNSDGGEVGCKSVHTGHLLKWRFTLPFRFGDIYQQDVI